MIKILNNKNFVSVLCAGFMLALVLSNSSFAHHSFAMYDTTKSMNFTGKLIRFIPGANHAQMLFEIIDEEGEYILGDNGKPLVWGLETGSSSSIARQGVTVAAFPEGTIVNFSINPLRNGKTFGLQDGRLLKCGIDLPEGGCNEGTGEIFMTRRGAPPGR